jgi:hypothetical protein
MSMKSHGAIILRGENRRTWTETCPSATLSITYTTRTDQGLHGERPVTNCLSHGMAILRPSSTTTNRLLV